MLPGIIPPSRTGIYRAGVSTEQATGLGAVYRAFQIMETSVEQLSMYAERNGERDSSANASLVKRPSLDMDPGEFCAGTVLSLMASGNFYWLHKGVMPGTKTPADLVLLNPHEVHVTEDQHGTVTYHYRGRKYGRDEMTHRYMLRLPGKLTGIGPVQAAQIELRGALELRDYSALWFSESSIPSGVLTTEQVLTADDAKAYRAAWNATPDTGNPSGVKVLGKGLKYEHLFLKPADAQWLESQKFTTTAVARLFGMPSSLLLAPVEGTTDAYRNVEQDWLAFTRFTLMGYLRKIETAISALLPRGTEARFNIEALLRADTKSRYDSYKVGIDAGFLHPDEVRAIEGRKPLTDAQRADLAALRNKSAPAPQETAQ